MKESLDHNNGSKYAAPKFLIIRMAEE